MEPFIGTEALAGGALTRGQLRWNYQRIYPNVYVPKDASTDLLVRTHAAWLWSKRRGIVAGRAAVALYGGSIQPDAPVELIGTMRGYEPGIITRNERIADNEITTARGLPVTTPVRTALDLARHLPRDKAIPHLDRLATKTKVTADDAWELADRYRSARGVERARTTLCDMTGGVQSLEESRLRMILLDAGLPRPETDITVGEGFDALRVPMGWPGVRVGVRYRAGPPPPELAKLSERDDLDLALAGWLMVTAVPQHRREEIVSAAHNALRYRMGIRR